MPLRVLLNNSPVPALDGTVSVSLRLNGRSDARFEVLDIYGLIRPSFGDRVQVDVTDPDADDALFDGCLGGECLPGGDSPLRVLFGGTLKRTQRALRTGMNVAIPETSLFDEVLGGEAPFAADFQYQHHSSWSCDAVDYSEIADRVVCAARSFSGQTLFTIVSDVVNTELATYDISLLYVPSTIGITPIIDEFEITAGQKASDVFNQLSQITGFIWYIDEFLNLVFTESGGLLAPVQFTEESGNWELGSLVLEYDASKYANRVYLERAGGTISYSEDAAAIALLGRFDYYVKRDDITSADAATEITNGLLRKLKRILRPTSIATTVHGIKPGQRLGMYMASLGLSDAFLVETVDLSIPTDHLADLQPHIIYQLKLSDAEPIGDDVSYFRARLAG